MKNKAELQTAYRAVIKKNMTHKSILFSLTLAFTLYLFSPLNCASDLFAHENEEKEKNNSAVTIKLEPGDTLLSVMLKNSAPTNQAYLVTKQLSKHLNLKRIKNGSVLEMKFENSSNNLEHVKLIDNEGNALKIEIKSDKPNIYKTNTKPPSYKRALLYASDTIENSLFSSASSQGVPDKITMKIISLYEKSNLNMRKDIKPGSEFEILYECFMDDEGNIVKYGDPIYSNIIIKNKKMQLYKHIKSDGTQGYFNPEGQSSTYSNSILKIPVSDGTRISSKFGNRIHPISGKKQLHKGVDFATSKGSHVESAADGVVEYVGNNGSYGKYVRIKHKSGYKTAYAHLDEYRKGLKSGDKIKQGELIGYTGSTGKVTGPHLHYEVWHNNKPIDPMNISPKTLKHALPPSEMNQFKNAIAKIDNIVEGVSYASSQPFYLE